MQSDPDRGYEKCAYLYDLFATKENIEFFLHYGLKAGEILDIGAGTGHIVPLSLVLSHKGRGRINLPPHLNSFPLGEKKSVPFIEWDI